MSLEKEIRERAARVTSLLVEGEPMNPWLIGIDFKATNSPAGSIELRLGLAILFFEMKQYDVLLLKENTVQFVSDNIRRHGDEALDVYLTMVRYVVKPPPRRKSYSWFARMLTSSPSWKPPQPQWKWMSVSEILLSDDEALVIKGTCSAAIQ